MVTLQLLGDPRRKAGGLSEYLSLRSRVLSTASPGTGVLDEASVPVAVVQERLMENRNSKMEQPFNTRDTNIKFSTHYRSINQRSARRSTFG